MGESLFSFYFQSFAVKWLDFDVYGGQFGPNINR